MTTPDLARQASWRQEDLRGLAQAEVAERRKHGLGNTSVVRTSRSYFQIIRENVFMPVNSIMFVLGAALVLLGQRSDALISVGVAFFNVVIATVQEIRAKYVLDRISLLTRPKATVIRDGEELLVDPAELVVGDLLVLSPGDQIIVDGPLVSTSRLEVDESLLSGESDLVAKQQGDWLYSGSFCISGRAYYRAEQVGPQSAANQLTAGAQAFRRVYTPLQRQINVILQTMLLVALFFELLLVLTMQLNRISLVESVKMAVVIIGIVPKGLLLATSVAYALGAVHMIGRGVLIQQANAIEGLSSIDMLCLDKTGTLTDNSLTLESIRALNSDAVLFRQLLGDYVASQSAGNRTSAAIATACQGERRHTAEEVTFSSERKWSALSFDDPLHQGTYVLGAPDVLQSVLQPLAELALAIDEATAQGLRALLFASCPDICRLYDESDHPTLPGKLTPLGIAVLREPLRPQARKTLEGFAQAGIELKIISGDHPRTVATLAKQAGFGPEIKTISGEALAHMDDTQLRQAAEDYTIFGRITPHLKARLVQSLRESGHLVAMMGDGVNDVLSLKQASLGIAMQSGSAATRGVADIVLLGDSFAALPQMFLEGLRIHRGMHNILKLFLTRVFSMIGLLVAIMIVDGFPFVPKQNALLTLITEGIPTLALVSWVRPRVFPSRRALSSLLHFVIPAAVTLCLAGFGVFLVAFSLSSLLAVAQSALTTFTVICGLLLIPFVDPPSKIWSGGSSPGGDWRPSLLALGLALAYAGLLALAPLRAFFELTLLDASSYLMIGLVACVWALLVSGLWRWRLLERLLQLDWMEA